MNRFSGGNVLLKALNCHAFCTLNFSETKWSWVDPTSHYFELRIKGHSWTFFKHRLFFTPLMCLVETWNHFSFFFFLFLVLISFVQDSLLLICSWDNFSVIEGQKWIKLLELRMPNSFAHLFHVFNSFIHKQRIFNL